MKIDNNINIKQGGTQMLKVMQGGIQVWPETTPPPYPTTCIPASAATANPVRYASELVPYGTYALYCNGLWAKKTWREIVLSEGTENMLILTAIPKQDIPELADMDLYIKTAPGNTGTTIYTGCAYAFEDGDGDFYSQGIIYSEMVSRDSFIEITRGFFIDFLDPAVNIDGYMIGVRSINEVDSFCMRMGKGHYSGLDVVSGYQQFYDEQLPRDRDSGHEFSTLAEWEATRVELISTDYIQDYI